MRIGILRIAEYKGGSGRNDRYEMEWSTGDFARLTLGITYTLPEKRK